MIFDEFCICQLNRTELAKQKIWALTLQVHLLVRHICALKAVRGQSPSEELLSTTSEHCSETWMAARDANLGSSCLQKENRAVLCVFAGTNKKKDTTQGLLCSQPRSCREVISTNWGQCFIQIPQTRNWFPLRSQDFILAPVQANAVTNSQNSKLHHKVLLQSI